MQVLLLTEREYFKGVERFEKHGTDNEPGYLCIVDIGTCDTYVDTSYISELKAELAELKGAK